MNPHPDSIRLEDDATVVFEASRRRLFGIAYRILGNASDAEDVVQETWVRWQLCERAAVREPSAFLATAATRIAINVLASARHRRETYIGPWLPSPVDTSADPTLGAERAEALDLATLLLMERLTPAERAAYVLREAFDYPYERIADILESTTAAVRQLVSRARKHLANSAPRAADRTAHRAFFRAFLDAARTGDLAALEGLLAADAVSYTDGGGVVRRTARRPIRGRETIVRFLSGVSQWFWDDIAVEHIEANGRAAVLLLRHGIPFALLTVTVRSLAISQILWVMNPAKLASIAPAAVQAPDAPRRRQLVAQA
ncbi:RNA polymerase sigma factor SigJ [Microbacterium ulmi]|uniref:RNA polymerase sigma factor SigJ n=1 Tax=Microbacterium ulmi TaxID=179095 RepID=A0A7Y2LZV9_9MICO|nr:RNA polymerase sigma factor SigJ [Microbacterium ulmi]NII68947.1 RNA polymerase sigma-70 factor (ECF subfamily) [Microbacterium ulmi]NNH03930.1 RNA polymerase sigma factor SigJ [Microbacterium ulmi]